ncbi:MAG: ATP-binding protein [Candidatus Omnitrophota bacterium]|nr:ATP-binding protein [Candidatus Omnitrophota bacterium]
MTQEHFELISNSEALGPFRESLRDRLSQSGLDEKGSSNVTLAVDEALTNVIRHAYGGREGKIRVIYEDFADRVEIAICDNGAKFDPTLAKDPELPPKKPGGLGCYFIKTLMDKVEYRYDKSGGNQLYLTKLKGRISK